MMNAIQLAETTPTVIEAAKPAALYLATMRSETGRRGQASALNVIARLAGASDWQALDWTRLTPETAAAIRARLTGAPATVNKTLAALRGVARQMFDMGILSSDNLRRIENATKAVRGSRLPAGRLIEDWELAALMRACAADESPAGARDAAMIALAAATGMRREELVTLRLGDLTAAHGFTLRVLGKGNKQREVFITNGAAAALQDWLALRGAEGEFVFCAINKAGRIDPLHGISTTAAHKVLQKRAAEAGLRELGWHDFRRTVAGDLLDAGEDLAIVAKLLGHSQVTTTARYDRRPAERLKAAARRVSVPYFRRMAQA